MKRIDVLPLIVDLIELFYRSSRDALSRAKDAAHTHPFRESTGLTIFSQRSAETQATVESIAASFLTVEATINYMFFGELESRHNESGLDKWLKRQWKGRLSVTDRFMLLLDQYATIHLDKIQNVISLFQKFAVFRNRIIHPYPAKYDALVEYTDIPGEALVHAVDLCETGEVFSQSGLPGEIARISYPDAARCHEIMLLVLALLDAQFVTKMKLSWYDKPADMSGLNSATPTELLNSLEHRYYPKINPQEFIPDFIAKLHQEDE